MVGTSEILGRKILSSTATSGARPGLLYHKAAKTKATPEKRERKTK
jgi:hypothetical protein